jgi:ATP-dependent Lon protease
MADLERLRRAFEGLVGVEQARRRLLERAALRLRFGPGRDPLPVLTGPTGSGRGALLYALEAGLGWSMVRFDLRGLSERELRGLPPAAGGFEPGVPARALADGRPHVLVLECLDGVATGAPERERARAAAAVLELARGQLVDRFSGAAVSVDGCMMVGTAEHPARVPAVLREAIEPIQLHGYDRQQKLRIARERLVPEALGATGLPAGMVRLADGVLERLVDAYDPEPGVHGLRRSIGALLRRAGAGIALGERAVGVVSVDELEGLLGPPVLAAAPLDPARRAEVGVVAGLTRTERGGDVALVEALRAGSDGGLQASTSETSVRPEALASAFAFIRSHAKELRTEPDALRPEQVHVRATAAGRLDDPARTGLDLAVLVALASLASDRPVRPDVAAVGGLTLRGGVQPLAGLPEMVLAAGRRGLRTVLVPAAGLPGLERALSPSTLAQLKVVPVGSAADAARASLIDIVIARDFGTQAS